MAGLSSKLGLLGWVRSVWRVYRSKDTPGWSRWLFGLLAAAYVISPWDLIPDLFLGAGFIDDAIMVPVLLWIATTFAPRRTRRRERERVIHERDAGMRREA